MTRLLTILMIPYSVTILYSDSKYLTDSTNCFRLMVIPMTDLIRKILRRCSGYFQYFDLIRLKVNLRYFQKMQKQSIVRMQN